MLEFSAELSPAMHLLFLASVYSFFPPNLHLWSTFFYFKVDILAQIGCLESLSQSPPSSSSPSPSPSINKVKFNLKPLEQILFPQARYCFWLGI